MRARMCCALAGACCAGGTNAATSLCACPAPPTTAAQAFFWGSLTGLAEPLGGLLGYLVLSKEEPLSFGIVFSLVAGMMVFVSFKELLPSAFRFDAIDRVVSTSE